MTPTTKDEKGWSVYPRHEDRVWCVSFRVAPGQWRDRRIPRDQARTRRQAEKWASASVERLRAGEVQTTSKPDALVLVRDLESKYLEIRESLGLRASTLRQDESAVRAHVVPKLGSVAIARLDVPCPITFVDKLKVDGLSPSSIRNVLSVLRGFLDLVRARALAPLATDPTRDPLFQRQGGIPKRRRSMKPRQSPLPLCT
jgi:hypothetical protein